MFYLNSPQLKRLNNTFSSSQTQLKDFYVLSELGKGAFGKVFKVQYVKTGKLYALKSLDLLQIEKLKLQEQLKNEIKILSSCDHINIIKLFCVFQDKKSLNLVMELGDQSLFKKLQKTNKFQEEQVFELLFDVINALIYLHSRSPKILHRDIKPENILEVKGVLKIADFGWSNRNIDQRYTYCGTPDYLAPEMITMSGHDEKLDI